MKVSVHPQIPTGTRTPSYYSATGCWKSVVNMLMRDYQTPATKEIMRKQADKAIKSFRPNSIAL